MRIQQIVILVIILLAVLAGYFMTNKVASTEQAKQNDSAENINNNSSETGNQASSTDQNLPTKQGKMTTATLKTNKGDIKIEFYENDAPNTVNNFLTLAKKDYYDGVIFHRVIKGFMIQGGDPTGTGSGGPGYKFADELNPATESYKNGYKRGTVAMANAGPNTNGSQFFIMHSDYPLPNAYTIFGKVVSGMEVVDAIAETATGPGDRPLEEIVIKDVVVED